MNVDMKAMEVAKLIFEVLKENGVDPNSIGVEYWDESIGVDTRKDSFMMKLSSALIYDVLYWRDTYEGEEFESVGEEVTAWIQPSFTRDQDGL